MDKNKKLLLLSAIFMICYTLFNIVSLLVTNSLITKDLVSNIINIFIISSSIIGIILFFKYSLTKNNIDNKRGIIIFFSILFLIYNVISGILGFVVSAYLNKKKKRELPKLEIEHNYKWYVYVIAFLISIGIIFGLSNYFTNKIEQIVSYIFIMAMMIFIFRKDLKRDFKYFKEYFREYNSYVFKMYGISLVVLLILSISIRLFTRIDTATNQKDLNDLIKVMPVITSFLTIVYAPITEELLFRGVFRKLFKNKYLFIILSGVLFGAAHVLDDFQSMQELLYILVYSSLGCFLAGIYYKTNNLFTNIYFHFIQNTISTIALLLISFLPNII